MPSCTQLDPGAFQHRARWSLIDLRYVGISSKAVLKMSLYYPVSSHTDSSCKWKSNTLADNVRR